MTNIETLYRAKLRKYTVKKWSRLIDLANEKARFTLFMLHPGTSQIHKYNSKAKSYVFFGASDLMDKGKFAEEFII